MSDINISSLLTSSSNSYNLKYFDFKEFNNNFPSYERKFEMENGNKNLKNETFQMKENSLRGPFINKLDIKQPINQNIIPKVYNNPLRINPVKHHDLSSDTMKEEFIKTFPHLDFKYLIEQNSGFSINDGCTYFKYKNIKDTNNNNNIYKWNLYNKWEKSDVFFKFLFK